MSEVAVDFGTSNTVLARRNSESGEGESIRIPGISCMIGHRLTAGSNPRLTCVVPSVIHYGRDAIYVGQEVIERDDLRVHPQTIRRMKPRILGGSAVPYDTARGPVTPEQAGADFLVTVLQRAYRDAGLAGDTITFTAPVEAFSRYEQWLAEISKRAGVRDVRLLDEPTAAVFGAHGAPLQDERFVLFDFGGGTLDISVVRVESSGSKHRAVPLGKSGYPFAGTAVDLWIAEDFIARYGLESKRRTSLGTHIQLMAERTKIALSDPETPEQELRVVDGSRDCRMIYRRDCPFCLRGEERGVPDPERSCLGCLLLKNRFLPGVRNTLDRAIENATLKAGLRRSEITRVVATGGTTLLPSIRSLLGSAFPDRVVYGRPFDMVATGACRAIVVPTLVHDYAVLSWDRDGKKYSFLTLFSAGEEYPTPEDQPVVCWVTAANNGATRISLKVYEISQAPVAAAQPLSRAVTPGGAPVEPDRNIVLLNADKPMFIIADPPVELPRDRHRFRASFLVNASRQLLVGVFDTRTRRELTGTNCVIAQL